MEYHLGLAYRELNDKRNASEHLTRALNINQRSGAVPDIRAALDSLATLK
jgi:hypothetical protein